MSGRPGEEHTPGSAERPPREHPLVFVADLESLGVTDEDHHHLRRALRMRDGDLVSAADGTGRWRPARWREAGLEAAGAVQRPAEASPPITIGFAPTKGDRPAWAVQKLTELGVDHIVVVEAERSVVRWDAARAPSHLERLRRVAREAAMQSRRVQVPSVEGPVLVASLVAGGAALAEPGGGPVTMGRPTVVVGPEGGWAEPELLGAPTVGLGDGILRTETAAVAAAALLAYQRANA